MPSSAYAGLVKGQLNLVVARTPQDMVEMLRQIAVPMKGDLLVTETGERRHCDNPECEAPLEVGNVGTVMPGSTKIFCDDPLCLATYIGEHLPEEPDT